MFPPGETSALGSGEELSLMRGWQAGRAFAATSSCESWTGIQPPNPGATQNYLNGVGRALPVQRLGRG